MSPSLTCKKNSRFLSRGELAGRESGNRSTTPPSESQGGCFCRARLSRAEAPGGQEGSGGEPRKHPSKTHGSTRLENFPGSEQGGRGRRFPSAAPRAPRARGSGRAAGAAAAASSRPRLRRAASSLRPARPPAPSPRGRLRRRRRLLRRTGRACAGREVWVTRLGKFQVEGRRSAGASPHSPPAASWRSRAARPCTSSFPSRRPR